MTAISSIQNLLGRIAGKTVKDNATGAVAIALSVAITKPTRLVSLTLHFSAAPTTSEDFTITLNSNTGATYDTLLYSLDLSVGSTVDLVWIPDSDIFLEIGDSVDIAYPNTDTGTYGVQLTTKEFA